MTIESKEKLKIMGYTLGITFTIIGFFGAGLVGTINKTSGKTVKQKVKLENHEQRIISTEKKNLEQDAQILYLGTKMDNNRDLIIKVFTERMTEMKQQLTEQQQVTNRLLKENK